MYQFYFQFIDLHHYFFQGFKDLEEIFTLLTTITNQAKLEGNQNKRKALFEKKISQVQIISAIYTVMKLHFTDKGLKKIFEEASTLYHSFEDDFIFANDRWEVVYSFKYSKYILSKCIQIFIFTGETRTYRYTR